jgi:hypothetical protein
VDDFHLGRAMINVGSNLSRMKGHILIEGSLQVESQRHPSKFEGIFMKLPTFIILNVS